MRIAPTSGTKVIQQHCGGFHRICGPPNDLRALLLEPRGQDITGSVSNRLPLYPSPKPTFPHSIGSFHNPTSRPHARGRLQ
eukprot:1381255-Amorphochlora_amoeboformis.AAC.2